MCVCVPIWQEESNTLQNVKCTICLRKFQEYLSHLAIVTDKLYSNYLTVRRVKYDVYKNTNIRITLQILL